MAYKQFSSTLFYVCRFMILRGIPLYPKALDVAWTHKNSRSTSIRYIFHHIGKTGGLSMLEALSNWFIIVGDYSRLFGDKPKNLEMLSDHHIVCGHFSSEIVKFQTLFERYPDVLIKPDIRLISFIRDPLDRRISNYFYRLKRGRMDSTVSVVDFLLCDSATNMMANEFGCDSSNFKERIDKYFYIGIYEHLQESMDVLAILLSKPKINLIHLNKGVYKNIEISQCDIEKFKEMNNLDYLIYDYCKETWTRLAAEQKISLKGVSAS